MKRGWWAKGLAGALVLGGLSGCATRISHTNATGAVFDYDGMPQGAYVVGGGYFISYRAQVAGDLYIADDYSNRLLATISMEPGQKHEINYDVKDVEMLENLRSLGIEPEKAQIKLYFVPR